ncbi:M4 family metallopeptidase [Parendozoicomonas sp. Alg238-R29]|uniref:M4 family metallopeptidase n=1 Tax=Parendozoicomonas sp. Alg238-R29 TaxID=2993446 RepID=UPI00248F0991|nr:M4 family metallopeptidase [Parendozoicomonas sp. Alg238-R29]
MAVALHRVSLLRFCLLFLYSSFLLAAPIQAADDELIKDESAEGLKQFSLVDDTTEDLDTDTFDHSLVQIRSFTLKENRYVRYRQYYQGLEVVGRSVVGHYGKTSDSWDHDGARFFGKLARNIKLPVHSEYLTDTFRSNMGNFAREDFNTRFNVSGEVSDLDTQPVIWIDKSSKPRLAYRVSFRVQPKSGPPLWPHYMIAAADNEVFQYWNNIQGLYSDRAPGGNGKTGKYQFGAGSMPSFAVTNNNGTCMLGNSLVKVVSLNNSWWVANNPAPISYECGKNTGDAANGAWAPGNDAYVFANLVSSMYQGWFNSPVYSLPNGQAKQLTVLVNVGSNYENAFWDGTYLAFGDGHLSYYPLVSISIVSHELSHAFTNQHSDLIYANQSGAINEAFSDMAAIAAEYYLKYYSRDAYETLLGTRNIDWRIGDRITKGSFAMRSMDNPSAYNSAECEKRISGCDRTWGDVLNASEQIPVASRQSYIVHKGSGVMNRAFVNIVNSLNGDVRKAFALMVRSNMLYWTSTATFSEAACGVKQAAQVDGINTSKIDQAFEQVGVTPGC